MPIKPIQIEITPELAAWLEKIEKEPPSTSPITRAVFARLRQLIDEHNAKHNG
jgi:hypothetical protein